MVSSESDQDHFHANPVFFQNFIVALLPENASLLKLLVIEEEKGSSCTLLQYLRRENYRCDLSPDPEDLPEHVRAVAPADVSVGSYTHLVEAAKRDAILKAFEQAAYDHTAAAALLGLHPNYLHKLLRTMDLKILVKKSRV